MSILGRLNPLRIVRTADSVSSLQNAVEKMREDQKAMTRELRTITRQLEQLEQRLASQDKALAAVPHLQAQIQRCVTAYTKDARQAASDALASGTARRRRSDRIARGCGSCAGWFSSSTRFLTS